MTGLRFGLWPLLSADVAPGKLSEERYNKLSASYESERHALSDKIRVWRAELEAEQAHAKQETAEHGPYFLCGVQGCLLF